VYQPPLIDQGQIWHTGADSMYDFSSNTPGLRGACQAERPGGNVYTCSYKRCGRGLTAAPRLQFCCGCGSLARIHGRTWRLVCCGCGLSRHSLMACFADINVSQGSVATYARCGGIFKIHLTTNLLKNLPVKKCFKSVKI